MGTYKFVQSPTVKKKAVKPAVARQRHNRTYRGKDTKRILERKITQIKLLTVAFVLVGIFSYFSASYNSQFRIEVPETVVQAEVAQAHAAQPKAIEPQTVSLSVEDQIRSIAKELNFQWTPYLVRLASCESSLKIDARNTSGNTPRWSVDRGVFQINNYHHAEVPDSCAFDLDCATRWTIKRINDGHQREWTCDAKIRGR
jgi:hypothetical protein